MTSFTCDFVSSGYIGRFSHVSGCFRHIVRTCLNLWCSICFDTQYVVRYRCVLTKVIVSWSVVAYYQYFAPGVIYNVRHRTFKPEVAVYRYPVCHKRYGGGTAWNSAYLTGSSSTTRVVICKRKVINITVTVLRDATVYAVHSGCTLMLRA